MAEMLNNIEVQEMRLLQSYSELKSFLNTLSASIQSSDLVSTILLLEKTLPKVFAQETLYLTQHLPENLPIHTQEQKVFETKILQIRYHISQNAPKELVSFLITRLADKLNQHINTFIESKQNILA